MVNTHAIGVRIWNLSIYNVNKPLSENKSSVLPTCEHQAMHIGDFNLHNTDWSYSSINDDDEQLSD